MNLPGSYCCCYFLLCSSLKSGSLHAMHCTHTVISCSLSGQNKQRFRAGEIYLFFSFLQKRNSGHSQETKQCGYPLTTAMHYPVSVSQIRRVFK